MSATATSRPAGLKDAAPPSIESIPLEQLHPATDNVREHVGDVTELAQSIAALGLLEPIVVMKRGDGDYLIVCGARRHAACVVAGLEFVPATVRDFSEEERVEAMLVENLQRDQLTPLEEGRAFSRLVDLGLSQRILAQRVGRSQGLISKRLALLELPAAALAELDSGGITLEEAQLLGKLAGHPERQAQALKQGKNWTVRRAVENQLEEIQTEAKIAKVTATLTEEGKRVVAFVKNRYENWEMPTGVIRLDSWEARELRITPAVHRKDDCHAYAVYPRRGDVVELCTSPRRHKAGGALVPADEQEARRLEREVEKSKQLKARDANIALGRLLELKLAAPKIDERNMRLIAELLMQQIGLDLGRMSFRFTDEASQTVVTKKDGSVSRIGHIEGTAATQLIRDRLEAAKTPEEIMGVLLQAFVTARHVDTKAVPASQMWGTVPGVNDGYGARASTAKTVEAIAAPILKNRKTTGGAAA